MGTENRREEELVPHVRPGNIKTTTYTMLEAEGDTTTVLRPVTLDEARADIAENGHGHVVPRTDGTVARCGGPAMCKGCQGEQQILDTLKGKP